MLHIFRNKPRSIVIVAAVVVALLLICMLLITLSQMSSLNQSAQKLQAQIAEQCNKQVKLEELKQFMQTDEYVKRWAENNGKMSGEDILWIVENLDKLSSNN